VPRLGRNFRRGTRRQNWGRPTVPPPPPPEDITDFAAGSPGVTSVPLTWTASPTDDATTKIYQSSTPTPSFPADYTLVATKSAGVESHTATGLTADTTYYWVAVPNTVEGGDGDPTDAVSATTLEEGSQTLINFPDDFTYLGARTIGSSGSGQSYDTHGGLALRYEASDATQPKHLLGTGWGTSNYGVWEIRVPTTWSNPADFNPASYSACTFVKDYYRTPYEGTTGTDGATPEAGSTTFTSASANFQSWMEGMTFVVASGTNVVPIVTGIASVTNSTTVVLSASPSPAGAASGALFAAYAVGASDLDGSFALGVDPDDPDRLVFAYNPGYEGAGTVGVAELNYAAGTATLQAFGRFGNPHKATGTSIHFAPADLAATLGAREFAGDGGYYSRVNEEGGASLGNSLYGLTDLDTLGLGYDQTAASTAMVSFIPFNDDGPGAGRGRMDRPEADEGNVDPAWDDSPGVNTKWSWNDRCQCSALIWTPTKRGWIVFGSYGRGRTIYLASGVVSAYYGHYVAVTDPLRFAPVSGLNPYDIQPDSVAAFEFPTIDYADPLYNPASFETAVTSIVSNPAKRVNEADGCVVTAPGHPFLSGQTVWVRNAEDGTYIGFWRWETIDASSGYIWNSSNSSFWPGTTSDNPECTVAYVDTLSTLEKPRGAVFDPDTNILYITVVKTWGATGTDSKLMLQAWQLNG